MPKNKMTGLGRGLDALFSENGEQSPGVREVPIVDIDPNREQPRETFDEAKLRDLAESIKAAGVLMPLLVTENAGRFRLVAGERRWRAARLAGLTTVPCIVRDFSEAERMEAALIENLQREDLNAIEEAIAIRALMDACAYTQEAAAKRLGMSRPAIANALRLIGLEDEIQTMIKNGLLSAGHARALLTVSSSQRRMELAEQAVHQNMSVRELERLTALPDTADEPTTPKAKPVHASIPELRDFEARLRETLGVRAAITGSLKRGKIVLSYASQDELERVYELIAKLPES